MFLLLLALDLAVLRLILLLFLGGADLVLLVFCLEAVLGGGVDVGPHVADDLGDLGDLGGRVLGLDAIIDFSSIKEKCREGALGGGGLRYGKELPFMSSPFYPL